MATSTVWPNYHAVVFDLFGTLVDAPTAAERGEAAAQIAAVVDIPAVEVEAVLIDSWSDRHDGRLPTLAALAAYVTHRCADSEASADALSDLLVQQARRRLQADDSVIEVLRRLRTQGLRVGVLSDASADVAEAWTSCPFAEIIDAAVFSCRAAAVKPHPDLYRRVLDELGVRPNQALYCGDGGGDELHGATAAGLDAVRVERRGDHDAMAFGEQDWTGPSLARAEDVPALVLPRKAPR